MKFSNVVKKFDERGVPYIIEQEDDSYPNRTEILLPIGESYYALIFDPISEELIDYDTYFKIQKRG